MSRRSYSIILIALLLSLAAAFMLAAAGCGDNSGVTPDKYAQIEKGMTLDQVEAILGTPTRTHRQGPANNPVITWYYNKADSEGLVKISFQDAKVSIIQPYNTTVGPPEE